MLASLTLCLLYGTSDQTQWDVPARELQEINGTVTGTTGTNTSRLNTTSLLTWNLANNIFARARANPDVTGDETLDDKTTTDEEKAAYSPTSVGVSWTILGSLFFGMMILYIVNWLDDDVRRFSWRVLSQTICIFCAVLIETTAEDNIFHLLGVWGTSRQATHLELFFCHVRDGYDVLHAAPSGYCLFLWSFRWAR